MGTANTMAANPLNSIPSFTKSARRESVMLSGIDWLLVLRVIERGIRLPRVLHAA
jgi:hypothetical protein